MHTKGPWKIVYGGFRHDDGFSIGTDNASASRIKVTAECWPCTIVDQEHRDELRANANLIAAAPELLAALETLVADMEAEYRDNNGDMDHDGIEKARAAISKATAASPAGVRE